MTIAAVLMLAAIAAIVSYSHMFELAQRHGEPQWRAALFPLSVDGMMVVSSMTLLTDARHGRRGGLLPWTLLILGSVASLAANIAVADPTLWSRVIHAWPSFALIGAYELLMRHFRANAVGVRDAIAGDEQPLSMEQADPAVEAEPAHTGEVGSDVVHDGQERHLRLRVVEASSSDRVTVNTEIPEPSQPVPQVQVDAWRWALNNRCENGSLPTGKAIAARFDHKERWGRLIKQWGQQGRYGNVAV